MTHSHDLFAADQLLRTVRRRWWLVVPLVALGAALGAWLGTAAADRHEATATVLVQQGREDDAAGGGLTTAAAARLVRTRGVAEEVGRELGDGRSPERLLDSITTTPDPQGAFVDITASAGSADDAVRVANGFAHQFIAVRDAGRAARIERAIEDGERRIARLPPGSEERAAQRSALAGLRARAALGRGDAEVVDPAVEAVAVRGGGPVRSGVIGGGLGLLLGIVLTAVLAALDPRVRSLAELRSLVSAPQLAAIPAQPRRRGARRKMGPALAARPEPFEHLRGALLALTEEGGRRRIVVTSPMERVEGAAPVAAGLALALARMGLRVCAIDADLRGPGLASQLGLNGTAPGLADALRGAPLGQAVQRSPVASLQGGDGSEPASAAPGLDVIAAGTAGEAVTEAMSGRRMREVVERLDRDYDLIVFVCPPLLATGDGLPLLTMASGTLLVVRHSRTPRRAVVRAEALIAGAGGALLGVVATAVPRSEAAAEGYGPWAAPAPEPADER